MNVAKDRATVLVVDDEECLLSLIGLVLFQEGYHVLSAGTGVEALRIARNHGGSIDLLLTDVRMPDMDGTVLAAEFRQSYPAVQVVFMTAYSPKEIAAKLPGELLLSKPFFPSQVCEMVNRVLARYS